MTPIDFVEMAANLRFPDAFNPYADTCSVYDLPNAPAVRRHNLLNHLEAAVERRVDVVWIARDLGYRGGRRTGLALTDEANLSSLASAFGRRSFARATKGPVAAERTAAVIWKAIRQLNRPVFTWNVFPLHPHEAGDQLSNRCHTRHERQQVKPLLVALLQILNPTQVVAIGNEAFAGLVDLGVDCTKVRHPSYGGVAAFERGIASVHGTARPSVHEQSSLHFK